MNDWQAWHFIVAALAILIPLGIIVIGWLLTPIRGEISTLRSDVDSQADDLTAVRERITYLEAKQNGQPR